MDRPTTQGAGPTQHRTRQEESGVGGVVSAATEKASELARDVKETAQDWASSVASGAGQAWDATRRQAGDLADYAGDAYDSFGNFIRRYPVASVCIALGIGFLLGGGLGGGLGTYLAMNNARKRALRSAAGRGRPSAG